MPEKDARAKGKPARSIPLPGLRTQRQRRGISQREVAELAGLTQGTIWQLEAGHRGAYPKTIQSLCQALQIAPEELTSKGSAEQ